MNPELLQRLMAMMAARGGQQPQAAPPQGGQPGQPGQQAEPPQATTQMLLTFLAGAGFNEVAYAIDKLQRNSLKANVQPPGGIPQVMQMLAGQPQPQMADAAAQRQQVLQSLGPNPLDALAMRDLQRRTAMLRAGQQPQMGGQPMAGPQMMPQPTMMGQ